MTILTDAARAVRDAGLIHLPRHAAESSDDLDRPEGAPGGPCEACDSEAWPKQPYVATGVYSPYALCLDTEACKARQAARRNRAEGQPGARNGAGPESCRRCLFDIRQANGVWVLAWHGPDDDGDPADCHGQGHEPMTPEDIPGPAQNRPAPPAGPPAGPGAPDGTPAAPMCPEGCGCRLDGEDADRRECGCDGPCTGEDEDGSDDAGNAAGRS